MRSPAIAALCFAAAACCSHASNPLVTLSESQLVALQKGQSIYLPEHVPGIAWPRARVYEFVDASPWEVMAVFSDYGRAHEFIPNVRKSLVVETIHPWKKKVDYEIALPLMLPNERYTSLTTLSFTSGGEGLRASWEISGARFVKSSVGNLRVEPYRGGSVLCYTNLVDPGSKIAVVLRGPAQKQVRDTVEAICSEVVRMKQKDPRKLALLVDGLRDAMSGSPR
jgi:hypothetical protein